MAIPLALHIPFLDEWAVIAFIGLLLFGKRLPEVGRSIGKGIVEFKKGLQGIEDDIDTGVNKTQSNATIPTGQFKFDPETGQPVQPLISASVPPGAKFDPYTGKPLTAETVTTASASTSTM